MIFWFLITLLSISVVLESSITTLPLTFLMLLLLLIFLQKELLFFLAFISGVVLDIMTVHLVGKTSVAFLALLFLLFLYQRKYEIRSFPFVVISSFLCSLILLFLSNSQAIFLQSLVSMVTTLLLFSFCQLLYQRTTEERFTG